MARIFISHSYLDEAIAFKLVNFLLFTLRIEEEEIFCSSNPDQGLSYSSSSVPDQLKNELKNSEALIILITADSLHSAWIPFEAGAFWPTDKPMIPILGPGLTLNDLQGPLKSLLSISIDAEDWKYKVNNAINQLVKRLKIEQKFSKRRDDTLREFSEALRAWQSKRPALDQSQPKEIEDLKAQIEKLEIVSQTQKKELEEQQTGKEYRLPTEAEWEYAARAGAITPFHFGETIITGLANYDGNYTYANEPKGQYREETTAVGIFPPNLFGLYDMHGQVWEWCQDDFHENYGGAPIDGRAWISGSSSIKILRGGSWLLDPAVCRSAARVLNSPVLASYGLFGFRVVCRVPRT